MYNKIRPGKFWYDNNNKLIQAHAGAIIYCEGKYWWYGENKEGITGNATPEPCKFRHHGLKLYSSEDLYNWVDEGFLFPESDDINNPFYPVNVIDRPHILYNEKNKEYVMWVKAGRRTGSNINWTECTFAVCTGKDLKSMKYLHEFSPDPHNAGDFDLFVTDGKAYVVFENPHTAMILHELNEDYTGLSDKWSSHLEFECPPIVKEAPAFFEHNGRKYLFASGTTSYFANPSYVYDITDLHGEWKELGLACRNDRYENSFHAQYSSVFKHPTIKDLYIALGDRWLLDCSVDMPNILDVFYSQFTKNPDVKPIMTKAERAELTDNDVSMATYVWLPVKFDENGVPYLEWRSSWQLEEFEQGDI